MRTPAADRRLSPAQLIVLSFLGAIVLGGVLLSLPVAHAPRERVSSLDALFTDLVARAAAWRDRRG